MRILIALIMIFGAGLALCIGQARVSEDVQ
jgi:hypothetical protein